MRISDWSSDVCSSDLGATVAGRQGDRRLIQALDAAAHATLPCSLGSCAVSLAGARLAPARSGRNHKAGGFVDSLSRAWRDRPPHPPASPSRSEEHTSELQSLMRISYAVFCLTKKNQH